MRIRSGASLVSGPWAARSLIKDAGRDFRTQAMNSAGFKSKGITQRPVWAEKKIRAVFSSFEEIDKVVLYGSRAKGNFKKSSDIDLAFFGKNLTLETICKVHDALDELYLPYKFDLSIFESIENADLKEHIGRVGIVFFEKMR